MNCIGIAKIVLCALLAQYLDAPFNFHLTFIKCTVSYPTLHDRKFMEMQTAAFNLVPWKE
jgi:hypothetical protein